VKEIEAYYDAEGFHRLGPRRDRDQAPEGPTSEFQIWQQGIHSLAAWPASTVRFSKTTATGDVYNLKKLSDCSGNYVAAQAGAALGAAPVP
jgi:hypothetical protein